MSGTLKYHRQMCAVAFGEDSRATKYLDKKIEEQGEEEEVLIDERQLVYLLMEIHMGRAES